MRVGHNDCTMEAAAGLERLEQPGQAMKLIHAALTDVGKKRTHNEDSYLVQPQDGLFVVCDGMGGHASGEIASGVAAEAIGRFVATARKDPEITWPHKADKKLGELENMLMVGIKWANYEVYSRASSSLRYKGMGTTCVSALFDGHSCAIAHVGDSRCYRVRGENIEQLTEDHSLLNEYKKLAQLTPAEIKNFPQKNIITRALGMKETVRVDVRREDVLPGDIYLLCCDGLTGELSDQDILGTVLACNDDLDMACRKLIDQANEHGGKDNITVVLVKAVD